MLDWRLWAFPTFLATLLILVAQYDFLAFHTLAEIFAVIISLMMFAIAWVTSSYSKNNFLIFLACGYLWVGILDMVHMMSYKGLPFFDNSGGNMSTQFWIVARYIEATLLFLAPFSVNRKINKYLVVFIPGVISVTLFFLITDGYFPIFFIEGSGLTDAKIINEYIIIAILILAFITMCRYYGKIGFEKVSFILLSIILTICAELAFTFYVSVSGLSNLIGHIFKLFSFWLIFQAIIMENLKKPYIDLKKSITLVQMQKKKAEEASRAKSQFLSHMSHELRTPLNAIIGFSQMMKEEVFGSLGDKHYQEYATDISGSGKFLLNIINNVLDLTQTEVDSEAIDISKITTSCVKKINSKAVEKEISLNVIMPEDIPVITGDKKHHRQILLNLLSNAVKFTSEGGMVEVKLWIEQDQLFYHIKDNGIGISADKVTQALEPFGQVRINTEHSCEGTGIGLSLSKKLAELNGGTLEIVSQVNVGTTITLAFPL